MADLTPEQLLEVVRSACARVLELDPGSVEPGQSLADDLRADSLAVVGIVELVEQALSARVPGFGFPDEEVDALRTVGDVVERALVRL